MEGLILENGTFESVGIVDSFESFIWTDRYNTCGDFEIYTSASVDNVSLFQIGRYVWIQESEHLMVIEDVELSTDIEDGDHLKITGRSLEALLERRIVWGQRTFNTDLESLVLYLLTENVINPDLPERKIDNFIVERTTDPYIKSINVEAQYTGTDLYTVISELCVAHHIGFKIVLNDENVFVFSLYNGLDHSFGQNDRPYVIFSRDFDNVQSSNYIESIKTYRNVALIAGEGQGSERKTEVVGQSGSTGWGRYEVFIDGSSVSAKTDGGELTNEQYRAALRTKGETDLAEKKMTKTFEGDVNSGEDSPFQYGKDFGIGDVVQIVNEYGLESISRVTEFIHSQDTDGYKTYPTFTNCDGEIQNGGET